MFIDRYFYWYLSLHIGENGDSIEVLSLFSMFLKDKAFKWPQKPKLFWQFQVMFHTFGTYVMYLDIGIDDDDYYDDGESNNEDYYK